MNTNDERALRDRQRGKESQDRFYRLLSDPANVPDWITLVMPANPDDDKKGIDFYVTTSDDATIPVDVKSSMAGRKKVKKGPQGVCAVVIREELDDALMRREIVRILERWKARLPH